MTIYTREQFVSTLTRKQCVYLLHYCGFDPTPEDKRATRAELREAISNFIRRKCLRYDLRGEVFNK